MAAEPSPLERDILKAKRLTDVQLSQLTELGIAGRVGFATVGSVDTLLELMHAFEWPGAPGLSCPGLGGYSVRISRDDDTRRSLRLGRFPDWGTSFVADVAATLLTLKRQRLEW